MPLTLLNRRLIFVTGKGGTGKSTVALALGMAAAERGLRTIVVELARGDGMQRAFQQQGGRHFEEVRLAQNLFTISIDTQAAMEEYLLSKVPTPIARFLGQSKLFGAFAMATPGMRDVLSVGKAWELAQPQRRTQEADPYDLVIVDSPATGHSVGALRAPRMFADVAKVGPVASHGEAIATTIADRSFTAVIGVSTAEEMPVNETLELHQELLSDGLDLDAVVVNALYPDRFTDADAATLRGAIANAPSAGARAAIDAALSEHARVGTQAAQLERLQAPFGDRLVRLPFLFETELHPRQIRTLAELLGEALG